MMTQTHACMCTHGPRSAPGIYFSRQQFARSTVSMQIIRLSAVKIRKAVDIHKESFAVCFLQRLSFTLNFIPSYPQYVRLVMFSTWNCLATLRLVSENWQKKTLGHLLVKYTKLWINYCAHSINMTQRKFRQHNLMLKHSYIIFIQFVKLCRKFSELRNETSENVMQFRKMHYDNEMDDCNIIVSFHFSHII